MFAFFLQPALRENRNEYEQAWLLAKCRVMKSIALIGSQPALKSLYELILSLSQLRYREKDTTLFSVCEKEISVIQDEIQMLFQLMKARYCGRFSFYFLLGLLPRRWFGLSSLNENSPQDDTPVVDLSSLKEKIELFEENYRHVLQISAKDPLAYVYFINELYAFGDVVESILNE